MHNLNDILKKYWGYDTFRPLQEDIIRSVLDGNDTLALMPTGGGKSICYQVPAMAMEGICIVISPLIALMNDQIEQLKKLGIPAVAINSGMKRKESDRAFDLCIAGNYKMLYISPERLLSDECQMRIDQMNVSMIAVDEAHCISQWGYDFRPAYLQINELRKLKPNAKILALTATATKDVRVDIMEQLDMKDGKLFVKSFHRENLCYHVLLEEDKMGRILQMANKNGCSTIIYARNRRKTKEISTTLQKNGISSSYYHAGLSHEERESTQKEWINGETQIIAATNAFGMGIDKSDVGLVIHFDLPENIESYYQEAGRAGRDGKIAHAVLLYNENDVLRLKEKEDLNYPDFNTVKIVYQQLANFLQIPHGSGEDVSYDFSIGEFCSQYKQSPLLVYSVLRLLRDENYVHFSDAISSPSKLWITSSKGTLHDLQVQNQDLDSLLKTLLRSYEGLFDDYIRIDEKLIARRSRSTEDKVVKSLTYMDKLKVLNYVPAASRSVLTFTRPRARKEELLLDHKLIRQLKNNFRKKADAMINYIKTNDVCRSRMLVHYFGEELAIDCGICDHCRRQKNRGSSSEFEQIASLVMQVLDGKSLSINETVDKISIADTDRRIEVIRQMLDDDELALSEDQKLTLKVK